MVVFSAEHCSPGMPNTPKDLPTYQVPHWSVKMVWMECRERKETARNVPRTKSAPLLNLLLLLPSRSGIMEALTADPMPERDVAHNQYDKYKWEKQ